MRKRLDKSKNTPKILFWIPLFGISKQNGAIKMKKRGLFLEIIKNTRKII